MIYCQQTLDLHAYFKMAIYLGLYRNFLGKRLQVDSI